MPEVNVADGDVVTGADFDSIDDQLIITCTSSTRPTGVEGRHIFETDTDKRLVHNGTSWNIDGGSGWVSFTPSWTGVTVGNATQTFRYRYVNGGMWVHGTYTHGSTSSITGSISMTIPNSESHAMLATEPVGWVVWGDVGTADYVGVVLASGTATQVTLVVQNAAGTYLSTAGASASVPMTWVTGDYFKTSFFVRL